MPRVQAIDDVPPEHVKTVRAGGNPGSATTVFFRAPVDQPYSGTAFLVEYVPDRVSSAHFHAVDQFQVLLRGKGTIGRHKLSPYSVHFARAHTAYGPLHSDAATGWAFLTLRTRYDPGAQRFPGSKEKLKQITDRHPWQVTRKIAFAPPTSSINVLEDPEIKNASGLSARSISVRPHSQFTAPSPAPGDGQFVVALEGSLIHAAREHKAIAVAFIKPEEPALSIQAGAQGLLGLILNFPTP